MQLKEIIDEVNKTHKTLWILCGLPYSGKTYFGKQIIENCTITYISIDNILEKAGFDWDTGKLPDKAGWKKILDTSYEEVKDALKNNLNVLYDSTNHTKLSRDLLRKIAEEAEAEAKVIFIDTPQEAVWKRWEENTRLKERSIVSKELVEQTIQSFEEPTDEEKVFKLQ